MPSSTEITLTSTTAYHPLGERRREWHATDGNGYQEWVYVFNDEAATALAAGDICVRDPSATTYGMYGVLIAASGTVFDKRLIVGVAQHAIAAGEYGWILVKGKGLVKNGTANISADTPLTTGGSRAGAAINWADGATTSEAAFGVSLEAEATDNTTFDAFIDCAG